MPTFDTPTPIQATLEFDIAAVRITATDRTDTVVTVAPTDAASGNDNRAAEQTTVSFEAGELIVRGPKRLSLFGPSRRSGSIRLSIELPTGSSVRADGPMADYTCVGRLSATNLSTSMGRINVAETGTARIKTSYGDVRLAHAAGDAEVNGCGLIELGDLGGAATVKNSNGDIRIDRISGALRASTANGHISVDRAGADVEAKSACGRVRIGEVTQGHVRLRTAAGDLSVGIGPSTAAWLELDTSFGTVRNGMTEATGPGEATHTVEVSAKTSYGDVIVSRAQNESLK